MSKSNQASQDTEQERIEGEEQFMNEPIITGSTPYIRTTVHEMTNEEIDELL